MVLFTVAADGFLYNMVRIMVGTLLRVQQGKLAPEDIPGVLAAQDRRAAGPTAPAWGLYLNLGVLLNKGPLAGARERKGSYGQAQRKTEPPEDYPAEGPPAGEPSGRGDPRRGPQGRRGI